MIDEVVLGGDKKGYVAVYADGGGAPGQVLGNSGLVGPGTVRSVEVKLDPPLTANGPLHVVLHAEDDGNKSFDFPAHDQPVTVGSGVVTAIFAYKVTR